jgi:hypothetical protein
VLLRFLHAGAERVQDGDTCVNGPVLEVFCQQRTASLPMRGCDDEAVPPAQSVA